MKTMSTNEIKKGMRIRLRNGWYGTMMDNRKGNIRLAEVEGYCTETCSVYAHDIMVVQPEKDGEWVAVVLDARQEKFMKGIRAAGF